MAFWHAYGPYEMGEGIPASAFSKGDILTYNSSSSLSRANNTATNDDIAGIATADSTQSIGDKVTFVKVNSDTVFWADVNAGSAQTRGALSSLSYTAAVGHAVLSTGTAGNRVIIERGPANIPQQSVQSRVLVRFIGHDGNLAHS
jgi:hypothetical protein